MQVETLIDLFLIELGEIRRKQYSSVEDFKYLLEKSNKITALIKESNLRTFGAITWLKGAVKSIITVRDDVDQYERIKLFDEAKEEMISAIVHYITMHTI